MVRLTNPEPLSFWFSGILWTRLEQINVSADWEEGLMFHRPYVYSQKANFKPFSFLELGFARTVMIGGVGSGNPLTAGNFVRSFFGKLDPRIGSVPGDVRTEMDWTFYVPKVRHYIVFYGDGSRMMILFLF